MPRLISHHIKLPPDDHAELSRRFRGTIGIAAAVRAAIRELLAHPDKFPEVREFNKPGINL